jgi:hypothetical protein
MTYGPHGRVAKSQHVVLPLSRPEPMVEPLPWRDAAPLPATTGATAGAKLTPVGDNTVRSFYYARTTVRSPGSSTTVSRSDNIRLTF